MNRMEKLLLLSLLFGRKAAIAARGKLLLELVDPARRVDVLQFAGVERMTCVTNVDLELGFDAAGGKGVATTAGHRRFLILGMDAVFHRCCLFTPGECFLAWYRIR